MWAKNLTRNDGNFSYDKVKSKSNEEPDSEEYVDSGNTTLENWQKSVISPWPYNLIWGSLA